MKALTLDLPFGHVVLNIACHEKYSVLDLFQLIASKLGVEAYPEFQSPRKGDIKHSFADISKAEKLLNYKPEVSLGEGLERTIAYFKARLVRAQ